MKPVMPMFDGDAGLPENIGMLPAMENAMGINHDRTGQEKIQTKGGPLPQINMPGEPIIENIENQFSPQKIPNKNHLDQEEDDDHILRMARHANAIKNKAKFQMGQKLIRITNDWFGPMTSSRPKVDSNKPKKYGVTNPTAEELAQERASLTPEEKCMRDPFCLQPDAARLALIVFGTTFLLILLLVWFLCTCKKNKQRHEYERAENDFNFNEMSDFQPQNHYGADSSDEEMIRKEKKGKKED